MKFGFVAKHRGVWPVGWLCEALGVSRSGFHAWLSRPPSPREWVADFTYIWTAEGSLYVAAVIDLFSRRVVGWSMQATMTAQLVTDALMMAIWRRGKPQALLHRVPTRAANTPASSFKSSWPTTVSRAA